MTTKTKPKITSMEEYRDLVAMSVSKPQSKKKPSHRQSLEQLGRDATQTAFAFARTKIKK